MNKTKSAAKPDSEAPALLLPHEAAARLRIHVETVRRWLRQGKVTRLKIGRGWRIPASELERLEREALMQCGVPTKQPK